MTDRLRSRRLRTASVLICTVALVACGGTESRKLRYLERAQAQVTEQDFEKAQLELRNALQIDPDFVQARVLAGQVSEHLGDPRSALQHFQVALELDPANVMARAGLAQVYVFGGMPEKGLELVEAGLAELPDDPRLLTVRGAAKVLTGDYDGATADAEKALAKAPGLENAVSLLASLYAKRDRVEDARMLLEDALSSLPRNVDLRRVLAEIYLKSDQRAQAERLLHEVIELQPDKLAHRYTLSRFLVADGRTKDAEEVLLAVIARDPDNLEAKSTLVNLLASGESLDAAETALLGFVKDEPKNTELRLLLADFYARRGKTAQANTTYVEIVRRDGTGPSGLAARSRLAAIALRDKRLAEANRLIEEVLAASPQDNDALILRADMALARGQAAAAITDLRAILRDQPTAVPVQRALAQAYLQSNDLELAEETLQEAAEINPGSPELSVDLAQLLIRSGQLDRALQLLQYTVAKSPDNVDAQEQLFLIYLSRKDMAQARAIAEAVRSARPDLSLGDYLAGLVNRADGKTAAALASFEAALKLRPNASEPLTAIVELLVSQKRSDEAIARVAAVVSAQPKNAVARNLQGELLTTSRRLPDALSAFDEAIGLSPNWWVPYRGKAIAQIALEDTAAAVQTLERGLKDTGGAVSLAVDLAALHVRLSQPEKAIATYEARLSDNASHAVIANNLAMLLATYRSDARSLEQARQLTLKFKDTSVPAFLNTSGWVAYKQGRYPEAVELLQRAADKQPGAPIMRYHLALAQIKAGQGELARQNLEAALKSSTAFPGADDARIQLEQLRRS